MMNETTKTEVEAAVFRRLLKHLDENKDVQNIDLMNLANFLPQLLEQVVRIGSSRTSNRDRL